MLSDLRCPGSVGRPAGTVVVRTCAGGHDLGIHDKFPTPGMNTPSTFPFDDLWYATIATVFFSERSRAYTNRAERARLRVLITSEHMPKTGSGGGRRAEGGRGERGVAGVASHRRALVEGGRSQKGGRGLKRNEFEQAGEHSRPKCKYRYILVLKPQRSLHFVQSATQREP